MTIFQREFEEEMRDDLRHLLGGLRMDSGDMPHVEIPLIMENPSPMGSVFKFGPNDTDLLNAFSNWQHTPEKTDQYDVFKDGQKTATVI